MKFFKKKEETKSIADENKELDERYRNLLLKSRVDNVKDGKDYENLTINKNLVLLSEADKNEAEKRKAESQTQSKFVNGVQIGCTVVSTAAEGNGDRSEVGKTIANYGKTVIGYFKKK